jgi:hypothetical protein
MAEDDESKEISDDKSDEDEGRSEADEPEGKEGEEEEDEAKVEKTSSSKAQKKDKDQVTKMEVKDDKYDNVSFYLCLVNETFLILCLSAVSFVRETDHREILLSNAHFALGWGRRRRRR